MDWLDRYWDNREHSDAEIRFARGWGGDVDEVFVGACTVCRHRPASRPGSRCELCAGAEHHNELLERMQAPEYFRPSNRVGQCYHCNGSLFEYHGYIECTDKWCHFTPTPVENWRKR